MSGTVISPNEWATSTGVEEAGLTWELVDVPMTFDVANRPVVVRAAANMAQNGGPEEFDKLVKGIENILDIYPDTNTLIHTVSYPLMNQLVARLRQGAGRQVISYQHAGDRDLALRRFKDEPGGVIVAPSLDRGVDLPGDFCRVQIVAKVPFPYLGDRQVSERMRQPDGNLWYAVQTARSLVQMTGRAVRGTDDWADTYVLDAQFGKWYARWGTRLLPKWWRDAITNRPPDRQQVNKASQPVNKGASS
jgi:Rad3-related DNA helicase